MEAIDSITQIKGIQIFGNSVVIWDTVQRLMISSGFKDRYRKLHGELNLELQYNV